jgi:hypothetical protein
VIDTGSSTHTGISYRWALLLRYNIYLCCYSRISGERGSVLGSGTMLQAGRSGVRISMRSFDFSIDLILPTAIWHWVDSASNRNEYQESSWGEGRPVREADNLTAIWETTVYYKMWEARRLTNLWASTACYSDSYNFSFLIQELAAWGHKFCMRHWIILYTQHDWGQDHGKAPTVSKNNTYKTQTFQTRAPSMLLE